VKLPWCHRNRHSDLWSTSTRCRPLPSLCTTFRCVHSCSETRQGRVQCKCTCTVHVSVTFKVKSLTSQKVFCGADAHRDVSEIAVVVGVNDHLIRSIPWHIQLGVQLDVAKETLILQHNNRTQHRSNMVQHELADSSASRSSCICRMLQQGCHDVLTDTLQCLNQSDDMLCRNGGHINDFNAFFRRHRPNEASWYVQAECLRFRADRTAVERCDAAATDEPRLWQGDENEHERYAGCRGVQRGLHLR
jgi:hypothetical protein